MNRLTIALATLALVATAAGAATVVNKDGQAYTLTVTENGQRSEVGVGAGESISVCAAGCFLTLPNGDREALSGQETVEISGGKATIK
jgi:hypothetical protein